jgi:hypothetical protein
MAIGTLEAFQHSPRVEWVCTVLHGEGVLRSSDVVGASGSQPLLAAEAALRFVERHRKSRDGEVELRLRAPNGSLDFVAHVTWWPPSCTYRSSFEDWGEP